jgi:hypothetical protein
MALQTTTREHWAAEGPFEAYELQGPVQRDIPDSFIKAAVWRVYNGIERYHTKVKRTRRIQLRTLVRS